MPDKLDLFAPSSSDWESDPDMAFEHWLASKKGRGASRLGQLRNSSAIVYRAQWRSFTEYLSAKKIKSLSRVGEVEISGFLASLENENRDQRSRFRKLIERVLTDLMKERGLVGTVNPAVEALVAPSRDWKNVEGNRPTPFLTLQSRDSLVRYLEEAITSESRIEDWRSIRDRAMVAVFLGAGLKVAEMLRLTVNCIEVEGTWISVFGVDSKFSHRARVLPFASHLLAHWLRVRTDSNTQGSLTFPASLDGRPMHSVTALRATTAIVKRSGIDQISVKRASPQTLRNSYAATLMESGETDLALCTTLGFSELVTATRLRQAWLQHTTEHNKL